MGWNGGRTGRSAPKHREVDAEDAEEGAGGGAGGGGEGAGKAEKRPNTSKERERG